MLMCALCVVIDQWGVQEVVKRIVAELVSTSSPLHVVVRIMTDRLLVLAATPQLSGVVRLVQHEGQRNGEHCWTLCCMHCRP